MAITKTKLNSKKLLKNYFYYESYRMTPKEVEDKVANQEELEDRLKAILVCAAADGELSEAESDWVLGSALARGLPVEVVEDLLHYTPEDSKKLFAKVAASGKQRGRDFGKGVIYNTLRACGADGEIPKAEYNKILEFAKALNVPQRTVEELYRLYLKENEIKHQIGEVLGS